MFMLRCLLDPKNIYPIHKLKQVNNILTVGEHNSSPDTKFCSRNNKIDIGGFPIQ
jgi:hypothetical protein